MVLLAVAVRLVDSDALLPIVSESDTGITSAVRVVLTPMGVCVPEEDAEVEGDADALPVT